MHPGFWLQYLCHLIILLQLPIKSLAVQESSAMMQVDKNETSLVVKDEMQNGGFAQAESIIFYTKVIQEIILEALYKFVYHAC